VDADGNERDAEGLSPAMHALYRGATEDAEALIPDEPTVFEAAAFGLEDRLEELLDSDRALAGAYSGDGFTALHLAAFFRRPGAVRLLLERGADANAVASNEQIGPVRPLHSAAAAGDVESARLLVEHGAEVNARQRGGFTALHSAAQNRDQELASLLISSGADPSAATDDGALPDLDFLA
jgi:ankyrin repeat protein